MSNVQSLISRFEPERSQSSSNMIPKQNITSEKNPNGDGKVNKRILFTPEPDLRSMVNKTDSMDLDQSASGKYSKLLRRLSTNLDALEKMIKIMRDEYFVDKNNEGVSSEDALLFFSAISGKDVRFLGWEAKESKHDSLYHILSEYTNEDAESTNKSNNSSHNLNIKPDECHNDSQPASDEHQNLDSIKKSANTNFNDNPNIDSSSLSSHIALNEFRITDPDIIEPPETQPPKIQLPETQLPETQSKVVLTMGDGESTEINTDFNLLPKNSYKTKALPKLPSLANISLKPESDHESTTKDVKPQNSETKKRDHKPQTDEYPHPHPDLDLSFEEQTTKEEKKILIKTKSPISSKSSTSSSSNPDTFFSTNDDSGYPENDIFDKVSTKELLKTPDTPECDGGRFNSLNKDMPPPPFSISGIVRDHKPMPLQPPAKFDETKEYLISGRYATSPRLPASDDEEEPPIKVSDIPQQPNVSEETNYNKRNGTKWLKFKGFKIKGMKKSQDNPSHPLSKPQILCKKPKPNNSTINDNNIPSHTDTYNNHKRTGNHVSNSQNTKQLGGNSQHIQTGTNRFTPQNQFNYQDFVRSNIHLSPTELHEKLIQELKLTGHSDDEIESILSQFNKRIEQGIQAGLGPRDSIILTNFNELRKTIRNTKPRLDTISGTSQSDLASAFSALLDQKFDLK